MVQLCTYRSNRFAGLFKVTHSNGSFVAVDTCDGQPGRKVEHVLQNLFIELKIGQLPLPLQGTQVDLVWGQVLGEPKQKTIVILSQKVTYLWGRKKNHAFTFRTKEIAIAILYTQSG